MDSLVLKGLTEVEGMRFHDIEGGFGEGKKSMLVKDIALIHDRDLKVGDFKSLTFKSIICKCK